MNIKISSLRLFIATVLAVLMVSNSHVCRADISHRYTDITGTSAHPGLDDSGGSDIASPQDARYHAPSTGRFMTVDQLCEEKPHLSGYAYCAGNPINLIDPSGMNEVNVDYDTGRIKDFIESEKCDVVNLTDSNGDILASSFLDASGVITSASVETASNRVQYDLYQINGDQNSTQIFEFLADNIKNEFSHTQTTTVTNPEKNYVTTSGHSDAELGISGLSDKLSMGQTVREWTHSHPGGTPYPSGLNSKTEDIWQSAQFENSLFSPYQSKIYLPKYLNTGPKYIPYTTKSTYRDLNIKFQTPRKLP